MLSHRMYCTVVSSQPETRHVAPISVIQYIEQYNCQFDGTSVAAMHLTGNHRGVRKFLFK